MPFQPAGNISQYNAFVERAEHGHFMQTSYWRDLKTAFGWRDAGQYVLEKDGQIAAACSVLLRSKFGIKILYVPRGPLWNINDAAATAEILAELKKLAKKHRAFFIRISPNYLETDNAAKQILRQSGFHFSRKQLQTKATMLIDLQRPEAELLASFHEKTRYNIRLAGRKGVTVSGLNNEDELKDFYRIMEQMSARQEYALQPYAYYKYIWQNLPLAKIYLAKHEHKIIGGVVVFTYKSMAYYMYGAFDSAHRSLMGNYLIHWEIMRRGQAAGLHYYDLQGVPLVKDEIHPMHGFYRFKKGFNGQEVEYLGEYDYAPCGWLYNLWQRWSFDKKQYLQ
ncbi:MAG: peptidoglycan bridge formation glycyltransferase FemA/FemB family protein [Candidatus Margulisbacteria bacterium]|jgi:lipid II:glycine glycyltransferase (peptidoglycan interpeptide bridge formation enzyme)|nr:peptidoglycan bridge formation glycyltransferase FemA/FemB family protein [Candidatus Margulisiibacteriota bacterium]